MWVQCGVVVVAALRVLARCGAGWGRLQRRLQPQMLKRFGSILVIEERGV